MQKLPLIVVCICEVRQVKLAPRKMRRFNTDGVNNYIAKKKRLRKRGGKKQTNVSGAVLSICFHTK